MKANNVIRSLILACNLIIISAAFEARGEEPVKEPDGAAVVVFAPDGETIVTGGYDSLVRIRNGWSGRVLATLAGHEGNVTALSYAPDGATIASGSEDGTIRLWNARDRVERKILRVPSECENSPSFFKETWTFSPSSHEQARDRRPPISPPGRRAGTIAFAPDSATLAAGYDSGEIRLYDVASGQMKANWQAHDRSVEVVTYSPDGEELASCGGDRFRVWKASSHEQRFDIRQESRHYARMAYAPDGRHLAICAGENISIRDSASGLETASIRAPSKYNSALIYNRSGEYLFVGGLYGIQFCTLARPAKGWTSLLMHSPGYFMSLSRSRDGTRLAYCTSRDIKSRTPAFDILNIYRD